MVRIANCTFQSAATSTDTGVTNPTDGLVTLLLDVTITGGTGTIDLTAKGPVGTARAFNAVNRATGAAASSITASGFYLARVAGFDFAVLTLSAISGATVTAKGTLIDLELVPVMPGTGGTVVDTELPTAAALNGTWAKTTVVPIVGSPAMYSDGTNEILVDATHQLPALATQTGTWTVQPGNTQNTTPWLVSESGWSAVNMTSATTTTVKSGAGVLHAIVVNKAVAAATITIYDNTAGSGTKIATITFGAALLTDPPLLGTYDVAFATGLTIVTSGATDLTISYR